jgi:hypothetical protein
MDIVLIFNGLGNQMSQYALFLSKRKKNPHTRFLYFPSEFDDQHNGFELDKIFNIKPTKDILFYSVIAIYKLYLKRDQKGFKGRVIRKLLKSLKVKIVYEDFNTFEFNPKNLLNSSGITFFYGGWHNEKYFQDIRNDLFSAYQFKIENEDSNTTDLVAKIDNLNSVSIHIRRGDYMNKRIVNIFGGICDEQYYLSAINYIQTQIKNPYFFIFSDDKEWVKENFILPNSIIVNFNKEENSWKDMYLISRCKHNINANSTFSWWGAWLNRNPNKIIVVPDKFSQNARLQEVYPKSWIRIPTETLRNDNNKKISK